MHRVEVSQKTVFFTISLLIGIWIIFLIRNVLLLWFISFILMTALNPIVVSLERYTIPRVVGIFIAFVVAFTIVSLVFAGIVPTFIEQTVLLAKDIDTLFPETKVFQLDPDLIATQFETVSRNIVNLLKIAGNAFSNLFTVFSLIVLTFYFLLERHNLKYYLKVFFPGKHPIKQADFLLATIEKRLGGWVRGEIILMIVVGLLSYIGLRILGIPFALPLALFAGLMELIPNIGPTISAIPAIIVGMTISLPVAVGTLILYLSVQQLENNIIVPLVMKKSLGLNPMITLMSLMVGLTLGGVKGALLAVPFYITGDIVVKHFILNHHKKKPF